MPVLLDFVVGRILSAAPFLTLLLAWWVFGRAAEGAAGRFGLTRGDVAALTAGMLVAAVVLARLLVVIPVRDAVFANPLDFLRITGAGQLSLRGLLIGAVAALAVLSRRAGLPLLRVADLYAGVAPLGFAVFSGGCLLRDDCFGQAAPPPFGIVFPGMSLPRYPVELYAAAAALAAYTAVQWLARTQPAPGNLALAAIATLALIQAALQPLRIAATAHPVAADQLIPLGIAAAALIILEARSIRRVVRAARSADDVQTPVEKGSAP